MRGDGLSGIHTREPSSVYHILTAQCTQRDILGFITRETHYIIDKGKGIAAVQNALNTMYKRVVLFSLFMSVSPEPWILCYSMFLNHHCGPGPQLLSYSMKHLVFYCLIQTILESNAHVVYHYIPA